MQRQHVPGYVGRPGTPAVGWCDDRLPASEAGSGSGSGSDRSAAAAAAAGNSDLPGWIGDPGYGDLPGSAAAAAAAAAGS